MKRRILTVVILLVLSQQVSVYAQMGKNGALNVSSTVVVNEYTALTADASAGQTSISVTNSALNTHNRFAAEGNLAAGDLVMIIQMQGATINGSPNAATPTIATPNDSSWGAIVNYNNCGNYEFKEVASVPNSTTIVLRCALTNNYTVSGKVQIIRVPRYTNLTVSSGGRITCDGWDSISGGIVAIDVQNNTAINTGGTIDASDSGFRGGQLLNSSAIVYSTSYFTSTNGLKYGSAKGEGIAGYGKDYNPYGGGYGMAAAANGGGGGDSWNAGGGGGANGGTIAAWVDGFGVPDVSNPNYVTAWNLEYTWMSSISRSGGGRGGYSFSWTIKNPLTLGPGNAAWSGDNRRSVGGRGGRPLDYSTGKLFLGGGGGAGNEDNGNGGGGGNGGGMVYLISNGTVSGSGMISANGQNGVESVGASGGVNNDAPGGAGAGGTIVISSTGAISGISLQANGGLGGNQIIQTSGDESEGAGGGGGGGYIAVSNSGVSCSVNGGANGTTNASSMTSFPANGTTSGGAGTISTSFSTTTIVSCCSLTGANIAATKTTTCSGDSLTVSASAVGSTTVKYTWSNGQTTPSLYHVTPVITTKYIVTIDDTVGGCTQKDSVTITVNTLPSASILSQTNETCHGNSNGSAALSVSGGTNPYSYTWAPIAGSTATASNLAAGTYTCTVTDSKGCITHDSVTITQPAALSDSIIAVNATCRNDNGSATVIASGGTGTLSYNWAPIGGTNAMAAALDTGIYTVTVSDANGCSVTASATINNVGVIPTSIISGDTTILVGQSVGIAVSTASGDEYSWSPASGLSCDNCSAPVASPTTSTEYYVTITNSAGCQATDSVDVRVKEICGAVYMPNAFSPNGDGYNDVLKVMGNCIQGLALTIYDRWGNVVFETTNPTAEWDGTNKGKPMNTGTYIYTLNVTTLDNNVINKKGNVTLLR